MLCGARPRAIGCELRNHDALTGFDRGDFMARDRSEHHHVTGIEVRDRATDNAAARGALQHEGGAQHAGAVLSPPRPIDVLRVPVAFAVVEQRRVAALVLIARQL
jgi:hypothetical protein